MMLSSGHNGKAGFYRSARRRSSSDDAGRRARRSRQSLGAEGFVVTDADGVVRYLDPLAEALLHGRADKLVGQPFGYRTLDGGDCEIDRPDGTLLRAEMQAVGTDWEGEAAYLISLHGLDGRKG